MIARILIALICLSRAATAQDVLILGEVHDNPAHHLAQAEKVAALAPAALVFEMLTPGQVDGEVLPQFRDPGGLERRLGWAGSGWPDFAMYEPIFAAAPDARVYGAGVPRDQAMKVAAQGVAATFGGADAARFGLDQPLPENQQEAREALQMSAHCDALPPEALPGMVEIQRLRDASLARATLRAYRDTGGPVAVITGNGHARPDWGMPALLTRAAPGLDLLSIGQSEDGAPLAGGFDTVLTAPAAERPDPCDTFR